VTGHLLVAAHGVLDVASAQAQVLHGAPPPPAHPGDWAPDGAAVAAGAASALLAVLLAAAGLWWQRIASRAGRLAVAPVRVLKAVHSGALGDYVLWLVTGAAALGCSWVVLLL
jgi:hypothetical protein